MPVPPIDRPPFFARIYFFFFFAPAVRDGDSFVGRYLWRSCDERRMCRAGIDCILRYHVIAQLDGKDAVPVVGVARTRKQDNGSGEDKL